MDKAKISYSHASEADTPFLFQVYASTRARELAATGWSGDQAQQFLKMQFAAQHAYYHNEYSGAEFRIIRLDGDPIGRLYLQRRTDEIRIIDISLLPEFCGRGWGSLIVNEVIATAEKDLLPVRIHVQRFNPALRLYRRLGFVEIEDKGVFLFLEKPFPV